MATNILGTVGFALTLCTLGAAVAGCGGGNDVEHSAAHTAASHADTAAFESYSVTGRVRSVTPDRDFLMIRHDVIEGFMDAMTMPFAVRDTSVVTGIVAGDSVSFEIEAGDGEVFITSIQKQ